MRIWILCADPLCAQIFLKKSPEAEASLCRTIPRARGRDFIRYVADEIELACGAGTESRLIVCAEREVVTAFLEEFSDQVRLAVIGVFDEAKAFA